MRNALAYLRSLPLEMRVNPATVLTWVLVGVGIVCLVAVAVV